MPRTILKTRNGWLDRSDRENFNQLTQRLANGTAPLLIHLHGGLVDEDTGVEVAERLSGEGPCSYNAPDEYEQLYIIWRSDLLGTLRTNWRELHKRDRLYRALLSKLLEFVTRKLGFGFADIPGGAESFGDPRFNVEQRLAFAVETPFAELDEALDDYRPQAEALSDADFEAELSQELSLDPGLIAASQDIEAAMSGGAERFDAFGDDIAGAACLNRLDPEVTRDLRNEMLARSSAEAFGFSVLQGLVVHGAKIGARVWSRIRSSRDHGVHATVIEEILRELYGDHIGSAIWTLMKTDTVDHFSGRLGSELLDILAQSPERKIVLVGHSAGAIFACNLLLAWAKRATGRAMDVVFLAPAVRSRLFADTILHAGGSINRFRMLCLGDQRERDDALLGARLRFLYPSSLLYIVSGLFEDDDQVPHVDAPLLGMERFRRWTGGSLGTEEDDAALAIREYLSTLQDPEVYSPSARGPGLNSDATTHGGIDNDPDTLASVRTFL